MARSSGVVALAAAWAVACGGAAFTAAPEDGGAGDASATDGASSDGSGDGAPASEGGRSDGGVSGDAGVVEASVCMPACPIGFDCIAGLCIDGVALHFSSSRNPNVNWTYGWALGLNSTLVTYTLTSTLESTLQAWTATAGQLEPSVFYNASTTAKVYQGSFTMEPGTVGFWPGSTAGMGTVSVVRWTAPASAKYTIDARFTGLSGANASPLTTVNVNILIKQSVVLGAVINTNGGTNDAQFIKTHQALGIGDIVDFVVDQGNDHDPGNDPTGLKATFTAE